MHMPIGLLHGYNNIYIFNSDSSSLEHKNYLTKTCREHINVLDHYNVCMDVFILFVDHRITLDEIYMKFS